MTLAAAPRPTAVLPRPQQEVTDPGCSCPAPAPPGFLRRLFSATAPFRSAPTPGEFTAEDPLPPGLRDALAYIK